MEAGGNPNLLIAADSNVPLDLADENESAVDAIDTMRTRLPHARFFISPSVFQELVHVALRDPLPSRQQLGIRALRRLKIWRFDLLEIVPVGQGMVESVSRRLRAAGLLPEEEVHDSLIWPRRLCWGALSYSRAMRICAALTTCG